MFAAILRNKLPPSDDRKEDLLTSVVFGLLALLPPQEGIVPLLQGACGAPSPLWISQVVAVDAQFWPWWDEAPRRDGAEPDVVLTLACADGVSRIVVVEAKRSSGKSGHGDRDQLARQVDNAVALAGKGVLVGVLYITADVAFPGSDLAASRQELDKDGHAGVPLWWASWRDARPILDRAANGTSMNPTLVSICKDASACLCQWGLGGFAGIRGIEVRSAPPFTYRRGI